MTFTKVTGGGGQELALTSNDVFDMVNHWLGTPVNGYLGSRYGQNVKSMLQKPLLAVSADGFIRKLKADVPIIGRAAPNTINVLQDTTQPDGLNLYLEINGTVIPITNEQSA
ncbi:MAG: hypothetical protein IPM57_10735 [Oligoflexia bacterium]|nr:hypothetical protein [Oligoflexia bacterium]